MIDYKEGFDALKKEFKLDNVNKVIFKIYGKFRWQLTTGSDKAKKQGQIISQFFDIYENSFE